MEIKLSTLNIYIMRFRQIVAAFKKAKKLPLLPIMEVMIPVIQKYVDPSILVRQVENFERTKRLLQKLVWLLSVIIGVLAVGILIIVIVLIKGALH